MRATFGLLIVLLSAIFTNGKLEDEEFEKVNEGLSRLPYKTT